ncbi:GH15834 [Drosophila grimshawi]|uniref:GH15834 n=1 Tax=Drosophila grimshawi TaxID=7222 RepID=B4IZS9_DROGR|nr:GH15834 [Drosophila grimshawi]
MSMGVGVGVGFGLSLGAGPPPPVATPAADSGLDSSGLAYAAPGHAGNYGASSGQERSLYDYLDMKQGEQAATFLL